MQNLNDNAWKLLFTCIDKLPIQEYRLITMPCGTRVMDAGIKILGSLAGGLLMAEVGMASLATIEMKEQSLADLSSLWIWVDSDQPLYACYLSQAAHWSIKIGDFRAMGSGPACLLNRELQIGEAFGYHETSRFAVLVLETRMLPDDKVCIALAKSCGVSPECLALLIAPTSSLAGSAQIAARSIETGLHKLHHLGFDLRKVKHGKGACPIAVPTGDDFTSLGTTNDCMLFASQVWLDIEGVSDEQLAELVVKIPSSNSPSYGQPFLEILKKAGDFYTIDSGLFAPAEVTLLNLNSGNSFHSGAVDIERWKRVMHG